MTEFETATLAIQEATLAIQQATLDLAYYSNLIALGVGVVQAILIGGGLWIMVKATRGRDAQVAGIMDSLRHQTEASQAQHTETMEALRQQGEVLRQQGEAAKVQHTETMEALRQQGEAAKVQHTETMEALRQQGEAFRVLIDRMAPPTGQ